MKDRGMYSFRRDACLHALPSGTRSAFGHSTLPVQYLLLNYGLSNSSVEDEGQMIDAILWIWPSHLQPPVELPAPPPANLIFCAMVRLQVKGLDDEIGSEAARLLSELVGGSKKLRATIVAGQLASSQPVQV